ncbi:MAG: transposase [Sideroxyarcus sp.]|nr:transposase [Sideroxyarcus sp.]
MRRHDWVVYAKQPLGGPAQVLEYLGRYTHRVAISNERILGMEGNHVRFRMRDSANGNRKKVVRLEAGEFIGRFMQHVLPNGFKRIRHYGLLGPAHKAANLAAARVALEAPVPDSVIVESVEAFMRRVAGIEWLNCPHCHEGRFHVVQAILPHPPRAPPSGWGARPCGMIGACTGRFARCDDANACCQITPRQPILPRPWPQPPNVRLTPGLKTLQSP